jgi:hypothetical protein
MISDLPQPAGARRDFVGIYLRRGSVDVAGDAAVLVSCCSFPCKMNTLTGIMIKYR